MSQDVDLKAMEAEAVQAVSQAIDMAGLNEARVAWLGRKGRLTGVLRGLGALPPEERKAVGQKANELRATIEDALAEREADLRGEEMERQLRGVSVDFTLPGRRPRVGGEHLITRVIREISDVFVTMGYEIQEGPEIELDYYNFTALNTPPGHPARSSQDTFYVEGDNPDLLLRTHTSPVQIRVMKERKPPLYVISPGRVYRRDTPDPSHMPVFHQVEGFAVDDKLTFGDLKGTLEHFVHKIFGPDRRIRFRPHFFAFTEPSAEIDVSCHACGGKGCRFCGGEGWLEILGAGIIDPNVLREVGYDPEEVTGFAFGCGVERIAALKYGIDDIRNFLDSDVRFLSQFWGA